MDTTTALMWVSITGLLVGLYSITVKYIFKCKFSKVICCGIEIHRDIQAELQIEQNQRANSGSFTLTSLFSGERV